jgi:hypothetical protein
MEEEKRKEKEDDTTREKIFLKRKIFSSIKCHFLNLEAHYLIT